MGTLVYPGISADVVALLDFLNRGFNFQRMIGFEQDHHKNGDKCLYGGKPNKYYNDIIRLLKMTGLEFNKCDRKNYPWTFSVKYDGVWREIIIYHGVRYPGIKNGPKETILKMSIESSVLKGP